MISSSLSYVTGRTTSRPGPVGRSADYVLDRHQRRPRSALSQRRAGHRAVFNTPVSASEERLNGDMGSSSRIPGRSTPEINAGVRFEIFKARSIRSSRSRPAASRPSRDLAIPLPCWFDVAPRFGVAYDLFGNAKTALKASFNKYMAGQTLATPQRYNPLRLQSRPDLERSQRRQRRAGNRDRSEQQSGASACRCCRSSPSGRLEPRLPTETSLSVQHELFRGLSVWFVVPALDTQRKADGQPLVSMRLLTVDVVSPLDGQVSRSTTLDPDKRGRGTARLQLDRYDDVAVTTLELGFSGRLMARRSSVAGGPTTGQRAVRSVNNPDNYMGAASNPSAVSWDRFSRLVRPGTFDIPYRHGVEL